MGLLEEINFFSDFDVKYFYPIYLVILNVPSLIYEIFPFIFLLSSQFLFLKLIDNGELNTFKNNGLDNLKILKLITSVSLVIGIFIVIIFYNLSANLQSYYLEIKNQYSKDKTYLAVVNQNGLWIKDIYKNNISIINSALIEENFLRETIITTFDKNYELVKNLSLIHI